METRTQKLSMCIRSVHSFHSRRCHPPSLQPYLHASFVPRAAWEIAWDFLFLSSRDCFVNSWLLVVTYTFVVVCYMYYCNACEIKSHNVCEIKHFAEIICEMKHFAFILFIYTATSHQRSAIARTGSRGRCAWTITSPAAHLGSPEICPSTRRCSSTSWRL